MMIGGIDIVGEELTIDGALLSAKLNLTEKQLKDAMHRGQLTAEVKKGIDKDAGRWQATFKYRDLRWVVIVEVGGYLTEAVPPVREIPLRQFHIRLRQNAEQDNRNSDQ